jgi:hypothetical protein
MPVAMAVVIAKLLSFGDILKGDKDQVVVPFPKKMDGL